MLIIITVVVVAVIVVPANPASEKISSQHRIWQRSTPWIWWWDIPVVPERSVLLGADPSHISNPSSPSHVWEEQRFPEWLDELSQLFEDFRELSHSRCNPLEIFSFYQFTCPCLQVLHTDVLTQSPPWAAGAPWQSLPRSCGRLRKTHFQRYSLKRLISHKREPRTPRNVSENITIS